MIAYEFTATVHDGVLPVAPELEGRVVRAIVLCEVADVLPEFEHPLDRMLRCRIPADVIAPLTREEANSR